MPRDNPLLKPRDIRLGDTEPVGHLLLRQLPAPAETEAHGDDLLFAPGELRHRVSQELAVDIRLDGAHDNVPLRPEHVAQQQLLAIPVGVERLVETDLRALGRVFTQVHEDLIFDAARGIRRELDVLVGAEGVDGLDEPDRADGDQILDVDAGVFKAARDVDDQPQVPFDERLARGGVGIGQPCDERGLLRARERLRQGVAAADVHDLIRPAVRSDPAQQPLQQIFHGFSPPLRPTGPDTRRRR